MKINFKNILFDIIVFCLFIFFVFDICSKEFEYQKSNENMSELKNKIESKAENKRYNEMIKINNEYVGWLKINNTKIDYPVFQHSDNKFYLTNDAKKEYSISGSLFLDYKNNKDLRKNKNTVIYGHDMKNKTMFGSLKDFKEKDFFNNNNIIEIELNNKIFKYKIFSAYPTDTDFDYIQTNFENNEFKNFIKNIKDKSLYYNDIVNENDNILTLSTCDYDKGRLALHAVQIN